MVLLAGTPSVCLANEAHDLTLERAVKEIVARKMNTDIRGTLSDEWRPSPIQAQTTEAPKPVEISPEPLIKEPSGSFIHVNPPAIVMSALRAATMVIQANLPPRKVRIVYE